MKNFVSYTVILLIFISSCASRQDVAYFQDEPVTASTKSLNSNFEIRFKTDDLLTIDVSALDPDVARPFNLPAVSYSSSVVLAQGTLKMQTYLS